MRGRGGGGEGGGGGVSLVRGACAVGLWQLRNGLTRSVMALGAMVFGKASTSLFQNGLRTYFCEVGGSIP